MRKEEGEGVKRRQDPCQPSARATVETQMRSRSDEREEEQESLFC